MRELHRVFLALALVVSLAPSVGAAQALAGGRFIDDDGNTHEGQIEAIAAAGITLGCNPPFNDRYCPNDPVTRGQMAAFIQRAEDLPASNTNRFTDDNGSTFEADINAIAAAGITFGCNPPDNTRFCPDDFVTRGEMAAFIRRAENLPASNTNRFTDDNGSTFEADINAIAAAGITFGCNPPDNDRYCPNENVRRDEMASFLARMEGLPPIDPAPRPPLDWELVVGGLDSPVQTLAPPGETRLLIAQQGGLVRSFENGSLSTFLDIRDDVVFSGERGLLSIAVHPDYPADRRLFAWYFGTDDRTHLFEYDIAADLESAGSPREVFSVAQPFNNHNGGFLDFGADGFLYLGLGDGGSGNDPGNRAQDPNTPLGKMLRINADGTNDYDIWASGLRNPWRWSFDNGLMYIGDVGQNSREEINAVAATAGGGYNFGWPMFEGNVCNPNDSNPSCSTAGLTFPVHDYGRSVGRTVTGGIVYRGPNVRSLEGFYLYADVFSGTVRAFRMSGAEAVDHRNLTNRLGMSGIVDFAEDGQGELLVTNLFDGGVYRLTGG